MCKDFDYLKPAFGNYVAIMSSDGEKTIYGQIICKIHSFNDQNKIYLLYNFNFQNILACRFFISPLVPPGYL